jgi:hypothetical protein
MNNKHFTIILYIDPSHAWGKVKRSVLQNLNIENLISEYSYQRGDYVYLEEDEDLHLLVTELHCWGTSIKWVNKHTNKPSRIRTYESFKPTTPL